MSHEYEDNGCPCGSPYCGNQRISTAQIEVTDGLPADVRDVVEAYARAAEDEYAAVDLHNLAAKASADYDRAHYDALEDDEPQAVATSVRALRSAELAAEVRAAKSVEERRACIRLSEMAGAGWVTEEAIRSVYGADRYGYLRAAQVVLAALE